MALKMAALTLFPALAFAFPVAHYHRDSHYPGAGRGGDVKTSIYPIMSRTTTKKVSSPTDSIHPASFTPGVGFQITIQDPPVVPPPSEAFHPESPVWDIDLFAASLNSSLIPALKAQAKTVICYFNAGAIQILDGDLKSWPMHDKAVVGKKLGYGPAGDEFTGETWVNVKNKKTVDLMRGRIRLAAKLGCDGVDPDNVDAWDDNTGFGLKVEDYATFVAELARTAHEQGIMIGLKNAARNAAALVDLVDFAVLENCLGYGDERRAFCRDFQPFVEKGKPVFNIEYPKSAREDVEGGISTEDYKFFCESDKYEWGSTRFSDILKIDGDKQGLDGWTQYCDGQPPFKVPSYSTK